MRVQLHGCIRLALGSVDRCMRRRVHDQSGPHVAHDLSHLVEVRKIEAAPIKRHNAAEALETALQLKPDLTVYTSQ
jgi:hypothetical protein